MEKLCQGFCFAFGLILIILAPILLFSGINPIMVSNPVLYSSMTISMSVPAGSGLGYRLLST
jgi:formate/nitrite transporter FocA (FNT family)